MHSNVFLASITIQPHNHMQSAAKGLNVDYKLLVDDQYPMKQRLSVNLHYHIKF